MTRFAKRSYEKELLDQDNIPFADIERNMQELDVINSWLGGHRISILGLKALLGGRRRVRLCEIGCGGGDNLRVLSRYCRRHGVTTDVVGIDINPHCIAVAKSRWQDGPAEWIQSDYRQIEFERRKPDIIFSSLFCHHFTEPELVAMLRWMERNCTTGWYVNDLHRHPLAYHSIRWLTAWLSHSYLVKNDAPLSVLRGFTRKEWERILFEAKIEGYRLKWKWAFRWLLYRSAGLTVSYAAG